jgi:hypothetical protein
MQMMFISGIIGFGAEKVLIDFTDSKLIQSKVSSILLKEKTKK